MDNSNRRSFYWGALLPAPFILIFALFTRRHRLIILGLLSFLIFVWRYSIFFIPRSPNIPVGAPQLRLVSFNMKVASAISLI